MVLSASGDLLARGGIASPAGLQSIVDKWLLLRDLRFVAERRPLAMRLLPDDSLQGEGQVVELLLAEPQVGASHSSILHTTARPSSSHLTLRQPTRCTAVDWQPDVPTDCR